LGTILILDEYFSDAKRVLSDSYSPQQELTFEASLACIMKSVTLGGKILVCGNGGSHADSLHFAGELVNYFTRPHRAIPVIALGSNSAVLTAWANDHTYETQFEREVEAFGDSRSVLIGFSTSGKSLNVINAFKKAKSIGMKNIAFTGLTGSKLLYDFVDHVLFASTDVTPRVQETHIVMYHALCAEFENRYQLLEEKLR
jgi:D-sedoheptulose 7-phosphate isomerase